MGMRGADLLSLEMSHPRGLCDSLSPPWGSFEEEAGDWDAPEAQLCFPRQLTYLSPQPLPHLFSWDRRPDWSRLIMILGKISRLRGASIARPVMEGLDYGSSKTRLSKHRGFSLQPCVSKVYFEIQKLGPDSSFSLQFHCDRFTCEKKGGWE